MTIHKSQGSEFDHVVVSLPTQESPVLTRELLYTAITRGRKKVVLIGEPAASVHRLNASALPKSALRCCANGLT